MKIHTLIRLLGILAAAGAMFAQQPEKKKVEGARDLFYFGATHKDTLPPIQKTSAPKTPRPAATQSASQVSSDEKSDLTKIAAEHQPVARSVSVQRDNEIASRDIIADDEIKKPKQRRRHGGALPR